MRIALVALFLACVTPLGAEDSPSIQPAIDVAALGPVARIDLALRLYVAAQVMDDAVMMATAVGLARSVELRAPTGWSLSDRKAPALTPVPDTAPPAPFLDFLRSDEAMTPAHQIAEEYEDLEEVLTWFPGPDATNLPPGSIPPTAAATRGEGILPANITHSWSIVFPGQIPAEILVIHDGPGKFTWRVADDAGKLICPAQSGAVPQLCSFIPAENGFYQVVIDSLSSLDSPYQLLTN